MASKPVKVNGVNPTPKGSATDFVPKALGSVAKNVPSPSDHAYKAMNVAGAAQRIPEAIPKVTS